MSLDWIATPHAGPLRGEVTVPGDKSISHRALMLAAIADGASRISGFLEGADTLATAAILARLGVRVEAPASGVRIVHGVGMHGLRGSNVDLDCGNAGTAMRLLAGLLAGQRFQSRLVGDASLSRRPMGRVIAPLLAMGANVRSEEGGFPPLTIDITNKLEAIDLNTEIASAQVKSAVLLAGLYAEGETRVHERQPTRDYTERMLAAFGWPIQSSAGLARLSGGHRLIATAVDVPGDFSSAAFFLVAATLVPGSNLLLRNVGFNERRTGLLRAMEMMGADIAVESRSQRGGEWVADLRVRHARLRGIEIPLALVPDMIDEFPVLFVAAALAEGTTHIHGAAELRVKESDRLAVMSRALRSLGTDIEEFADGASIHGGSLHAGTVDSYGDHRIAMSLAIAGQMAAGPIYISDCANVDTSFPGFIEHANARGFQLRVK